MLHSIIICYSLFWFAPGKTGTALERIAHCSLLPCTTVLLLSTVQSVTGTRLQRSTTARLRCWSALWELHAFPSHPVGQPKRQNSRMKKVLVYNHICLKLLFAGGMPSETRSSTSLYIYVQLSSGQISTFYRRANQHTRSLKSQNKYINRNSVIAMTADSPTLVQILNTQLWQKEPFTEVATNLLFIIALSIFKSVFLSLTVTELFQKHEPIKHLPQSALNNSLRR